MTMISPHPCGTAEAGSVLSVGREQGARCPLPSSGDGQQPPQGRTSRVCIYSIALSNPVLFVQQLDCQVFPCIVPSNMESQFKTGPKFHAHTTGQMDKCSAISGKVQRETGPPELVPQGNTSPTSSARSEELPGIWDGRTCFRHPHDLKGFSVSI